jgi:hypothetical protein
VDAKLLNAKYEVFLDQAHAQQRYRSSIDAALGE